MNENSVIEIIQSIFKVKSDEVLDLNRFRQGMSNYTYYFKINNEKYVIRIIGEGAKKYVNYYDELNSISVIQNEGLTSELYYFDVNTGTKVTKYIEGSVIDLDDESLNLDELIKSLKKLHSINPKYLPNYNLINRLNLYESFNVNNVIDYRYNDLRKWWDNYYINSYQFRDQVLCHNDLQDANIILSETNKVYFIDFEYAGVNDLYYDFASFENNAFKVFEHYFNKPINEEEKKHIMFYQIYQSLQWYQVASYKESIGFSEKTNYNFKDLANYFIDKAISIYELIK